MLLFARLAASNRGTVALSEFTAMAKGHTYFWRRPGRRDAERKKFAALMRKVEAIRVRYGISTSALAGELETTGDAVRNWMTGRAIGRKETVARLEEFIRRRTRQLG